MSCITSQGTTLWAENPSPFKEVEGEEKRKKGNSAQGKSKASNTHLILFIHFQDNTEEKESEAEGKLFTRSVFQSGNSFEESRCS